MAVAGELKRCPRCGALAVVRARDPASPYAGNKHVCPNHGDLDFRDEIVAAVRT